MIQTQSTLGGKKSHSQSHSKQEQFLSYAGGASLWLSSKYSTYLRMESKPAHWKIFRLLRDKVLPFVNCFDSNCAEPSAGYLFFPSFREIVFRYGRHAPFDTLLIC